MKVDPDPEGSYCGIMVNLVQGFSLLGDFTEEIDRSIKQHIGHFP